MAQFSVGVNTYTSLRSDLSEQYLALVKNQATRKVQVRLPEEIARWMGQPIELTGRVSVAILGDGGGQIGVSLCGKHEKAKSKGGNGDAWLADFTFDDPKVIQSPDGFELVISNAAALRAVVMYFSGKLAN